MTYIFNMHEAKTNLSKLVQLVLAGEEVQIARDGNPVVNIIPAKENKRPKFGEFEPIYADIPEGFDFDEPDVDWDEIFLTKERNLKSREIDAVK